MNILEDVTLDFDSCTKVLTETPSRLKLRQVTLNGINKNLNDPTSLPRMMMAKKMEEEKVIDIPTENNNDDKDFYTLLDGNGLQELLKSEPNEARAVSVPGFKIENMGKNVKNAFGPVVEEPVVAQENKDVPFINVEEVKPVEEVATKDEPIVFPNAFNEVKEDKPNFEVKVGDTRPNPDELNQIKGEISSLKNKEIKLDERLKSAKNDNIEAENKLEQLKLRSEQTDELLAETNEQFTAAYNAQKQRLLEIKNQTESSLASKENELNELGKQNDNTSKEIAEFENKIKDTSERIAVVRELIAALGGTNELEENTYKKVA